MAPETTEEFSSLDEALEYYKGIGFNLVKDDQGVITRTLSLRSYNMGDYLEVTIKEIGETLSIEQTINGKPV